MEVEKTVLEVGMAQSIIAEAPNFLITRGLGSCLGITLYDPIKKIGGLSHPMLPDQSRARINTNPSKFVDSVIREMLNGLLKRGCILPAIKAKIFGGAHMFKTASCNGVLNIGEKNIEKAREVFYNEKIKVVAEDVGGSCGRTVELDLSTGKVRVRTIFLGEKEY